MAPPKRRWRAYETADGHKPVKAFLDGLSDEDAAAVLEAMAHVRDLGSRDGGARKLSGDIWEVRVNCGQVIYRILYASVASKGRILLSLDGFTKKTQKTPKHKIELAKQRLADWRQRG